MSHHYPLFRHALTDTIIWHKGVAISSAAFLYDVMQLVERLPKRPYLINLCEDRYHFTVGLAAAMIKGQCNLLPPSRAPDGINGLADDYLNSYCLFERPISGVELPAIELDIKKAGEGSIHDIPTIDGELLVCIAFTSGSTGKPKANPKYWHDLIISADKAISRFGITPDKISSLIATVPPQHMYGLETSILIPWCSGIAVDSGRPFFPADLCSALASIPEPRLLISTPLHLRACVKAGLSWPKLAAVISSTAPLSSDLAQKTEEVLSTKVLEIFGSTESGSIASRRTSTNLTWQLYDGMSLSLIEHRAYIDGEQLRQTVLLGDQIEQVGPQHFSLLGRSEEMINIAGKRASLGDLNHKLNAINGVRDGVFVMPDLKESETTRLTVFVVAPTLDKTTIIEQLKNGIDAVFLPRPLYIVDNLPRNETGKLPKAALLKLLEKHKKPKQ
jgi:acyl-coenzyme A synthetase/AMP-(fatty) acid ligase